MWKWLGTGFESWTFQVQILVFILGIQLDLFPSNPKLSSLAEPLLNVNWFALQYLEFIFKIKFFSLSLLDFFLLIVVS